MVFAPYNADSVGIFNTEIYEFDHSVSTGSLTSDVKFRGAASVGHLVRAPSITNTQTPTRHPGQPKELAISFVWVVVRASRVAVFSRVHQNGRKNKSVQMTQLKKHL